jgi:hypothetical protein
MRRKKIDLMPAMVESMEPRVVLDSAFASVGIVAAPTVSGRLGVETWATEGVLNSEGAVTQGSVWVDGEGGRDFDDDNLWYNRIYKLLGDGRLARDPNDSFFSNDPIETNGAQFLFSDGFPAGWWFAENSSNSEEVELMAEVIANPTQTAFQSTYRYTAMGFDFTDGDFFTSSGSVEIDIGEDTARWNESYGQMPREISRLDGISGNSLRSEHGEYFYLSTDGRTILFADLNTSDGAVYIGIATRTASVTNEQLIGGYNWVSGSSVAGGVDFSQYRLDLEDDGDYKLFNLDDWDSGIFTELSRGDWSLDGSEVRLQEDGTTLVTRFRIGEDAHILVPERASTNLIGNQALFGLATRDLNTLPGGNPNLPQDDVVFSVPGPVEFGRPGTYQLEDDGLWYAIDLLRLAGGPAITGEVESWVDLNRLTSSAVAVTSQGLALYTENLDNTWSVRVLTTEIAGAVGIASELEVMLDPQGLAHVTGLSATGEVLHYFQNGANNTNGTAAWAFENISTEDLVPAGLTTPAFSGLVSYATSWGGLNIAGLDSEGRIWSVWTSPSLAGLWTASDLTTAYGADPLAGGLTVYLTSWQGINIAEIDNSGELKVTWWVPSFGGTWAQNSLTELTGGPSLVPSTVSSYVSSWDGLSIAGIDQATGELTVYWWSPARQQEGWAIASLSDALPNGSAQITQGPVNGVAARDSSLNVFGLATDGSFVRVFWTPTTNAWTSVNLSTTATAR